MSLLCAYQSLKADQTLPDSVWDECLWGSDPEEAYLHDVLMNRCQLLGLLVCLYKGLTTEPARTAVDRASRLSLDDKPPSEMTLRELQDALENLQMEWPAFLSRLPGNPNAQQNLETVVSLIDQCFARFGVLCGQGGDAATMDCLASVDEAKASPGAFRITPACIRRTVCTFLVLYRHLHLLAVARPAPDEYCDCGLTKYHMEASNDDFNLLCMHISLPVGAKLNYKHDFPGMYNHVSQVVFFHNSDYERTARLPLSAMPTAPPEQILPALMQLYPSIALRYEEDTLSLGPGRGEWTWLLVAGRIYLIDPEGGVWYSPSVTSLLQNVYLKRAA
jgi:hypothetical protein